MCIAKGRKVSSLITTIIPSHCITFVSKKSARTDCNKIADSLSPKIQAVQSITLWRQPLLFSS